MRVLAPGAGQAQSMRLTAEGTRVLRDLFTQKQDAWRGTLPQTVSDPELAAVALAFSLNSGQLQRVYRAWKDGPNMKLKLRPASEYTANVRTRLGEQDALVADAFTMSAAAARVKMIAGTRDWMGTLRSESWAQVLLTERVGSLIELVVTHRSATAAGLSAARAKLVMARLATRDTFADKWSDHRARIKLDGIEAAPSWAFRALFLELDEALFDVVCGKLAGNSKPQVLIAAVSVLSDADKRDPRAGPAPRLFPGGEQAPPGI